MRAIPPALAALAAHPHFIFVRLVPDPAKPGKTIKVPVNGLTGQAWDAHDRKIWMAADHAVALLPAWGPGHCLGWVLTPETGIFCLDLDKCITSAAQWTEPAVQMMRLLPGAAIEVSQSRRGLHLWGKATAGPHTMKCAALNAEFYTELRFIALTGEILAGDAATDHTRAVARLVATYFPPRAPVALADWSDGPCTEWRGPTDDAELIRRALASSSASSTFGGRASFADLWTANADALARSYPGSDGGHDASSADAALAQHLAFWTGKDAARIERLMRMSALARDKWDREDYLGPRTILGAIGRQVQVLQDTPVQQLALPSAANYQAPEQIAVSGSTFLSPAEQQKLMSGCVYVVSNHRVLVPGGTMLKPDGFKAKFGGYTFAMDSRNERTSRNAFEAFTESQCLRPPVADDHTFRPDLAPLALVKDDGDVLQAGEKHGGRVAVNTWWPPVIKRAPGNVKWFLDQVACLLPHGTDMQRILFWCAAAAQFPGIKFKWMPLLQGVEGNGKTLISIALARAVGKRYVHWPSMSSLKKDFNAFVDGRLLLCLEDVYVPNTDRDIIEKLKPLIAGGDEFEVEGKGVDQRSTQICCNIIANTNHKNGVPKSANDRRIAPFFTAQQMLRDLARDGLDGEYFPRLYHTAEKAGGYAHVAEYLHTLAIPDEFNPALGGRAPLTSSTAEAIAQGRGSVEQEILEAVDQATPGFAGGWISSMALDALLTRIGREKAVGRTRRPDLLRTLGYVKHPGLEDGRVSNPVMPDAGKPRLFIREDSPLAALTVAAEIARAYSTSQLAR